MQKTETSKVSRPLTWNEFRSQYVRARNRVPIQELSEAWRDYKSRVGITSPTKTKRLESIDNLSVLPNEVLQSVLIQLPYKTLRTHCRTSRRLQEFCKNEDFLAAYARTHGVLKGDYRTWEEAVEVHYGAPTRSRFEVIRGYLKPVDLAIAIKGTKFEQKSDLAKRIQQHLKLGFINAIGAAVFSNEIISGNDFTLYIYLGNTQGSDESPVISITTETQGITYEQALYPGDLALYVNKRPERGFIYVKSYPGDRFFALKGIIGTASGY